MGADRLAGVRIKAVHYINYQVVELYRQTDPPRSYCRHSAPFSLSRASHLMTIISRLGDHARSYIASFGPDHSRVRVSSCEEPDQTIFSEFRICVSSCEETDQTIFSECFHCMHASRLSSFEFHFRLILCIHQCQF